MRAVIQRVSNCSLMIEGAVRAEIGPGLLALVGFAPGDEFSHLHWMASRIAGLRVFEDAEGKMNLSVQEMGGQVLAVPNFTLHGDCRRGRRPGFSKAAPPELASGMFNVFCDQLALLVPVERGVFGAHMHITLTNDGPVTLIVDTERGNC